MTSAASSLYCVSTGCPKAICAPAVTFSRLTGSYTCHFACGYTAKNRAQLSRQRRRRNGRRKNANSRALQAFLRVERAAHGVDEPRPGADAAEVRHRLRTIGVVKIEKRRLREDVRARRDWRDAPDFLQSLLDDRDDSRPVVAQRSH